VASLPAGCTPPASACVCSSPTTCPTWPVSLRPAWMSCAGRHPCGPVTSSTCGPPSSASVRRSPSPTAGWGTPKRRCSTSTTRWFFTCCQSTSCADVTAAMGEPQRGYTTYSSIGWPPRVRLAKVLRSAAAASSRGCSTSPATSRCCRTWTPRGRRSRMTSRMRAVPRLALVGCRGNGRKSRRGGRSGHEDRRPSGGLTIGCSCAACRCSDGRFDAGWRLAPSSTTSRVKAAAPAVPSSARG